MEAEYATDRAADDVTVALLEDRALAPARAVVRAKAEGVFSGVAIYEAFAEIFTREAKGRCLVKEGEVFTPGKILVEFNGTVGFCLSAERVLLNLLSHACGVATATRRFVDAVAPHPVKILATRKTLPSLRDVALTAVQAGGGVVHRRSLSDGILIKDNHLAFASETELLTAAHRRRSPLHRIEIEVQSLASLDRVLAGPMPDIIMLDNFSTADIHTAVQRIAGRCPIEVSGGVDLSTAKLVAGLGVQYISVGRLTHSVTAVDLTMDTEPLA